MIERANTGSVDTPLLVESQDLEPRAEEEQVLPISSEELVVSRRKIERNVRLHIRTSTHAHLIDEALNQEHVEIERVAVGVPLDTVPPVREEGDITVIPVVEEVLVVERWLVLKEEIRLRRVRTTEQHRETVMLREQHAVIERTDRDGQSRQPAPGTRAHSKTSSAQGVDPMTDETIVAVYDTAEHAGLAVHDLEAAGVPSSAISQHAQAGASTSTAAPVREKGFWSSLFGGEPDHDASVYDRSLASGASVVTVKVPSEHVQSVTDILERHSPIDLDERAASYGYGTSGTTTTTTTATTGLGVAPVQGMATATGGEEVIGLSEEQLTVGKRLVNRGTTRIRRFVVETPVEEAVTLHSEHVSVERRPVAAGTKVTSADFTDKVVELTETDEEAVVAKTARVKEEVVINKAATDRVETVRDTVRHEDVEITRDGQATTTTETTQSIPPTPRPRV